MNVARRRRSPAAFLVACALAALAPLLPPPTAATADDFPGWPTSFDGRPLTARPLAPREQRFAAGFPGRIATFTDGRRLFVVRWVTGATRRLHPAADCFRGAGYAISPGPLVRDAAGRTWGSFTAAHGATRLHVRERIVAAGGGGELTDTSSWYWSALLGRGEGPWWAWTAVEPAPGPRLSPRPSPAAP